jgi:hypothetical protein
MTLPYKTPVGGTRAPTEKPAPKDGRIPMYTWRQPVGGVRAGSVRSAVYGSRP